MSSLVIKLWTKQPGKYFVICTKRGSSWKEHWFTPHEFGDLKGFIRDNDDKDIYFCPHGFNLKRRQKEYVVAPFLLWADLDEVRPHNMAPKPTIALESSPGRYVGFWVTDKPVSDSINRELTYYLGADKGGWDYTQVLRVPGTTNYKYKTRPTVKTLWSDGPVWQLDRVVKMLPREQEPEEASRLTAEDVYLKYQNVLPRSVRKKIFEKKEPGVGKRSEVLWSMHHDLIQCGMTKEEAFVLVRSTVWNKFKGRPNGDQQLKRELDKVVHEKLSDMPGLIRQPRETGFNGFRVLGSPMSEVEEKDVDWIWYPYLARGEVTIVEGNPGVGKSWLTQAVAAALCDRNLGKLPSPKWYKRVTGPVVYFDIENAKESVVKKRLRHLGMSDESQKLLIVHDEAFSIDDEDYWEDMCEDLKTFKPVMVVFDTINMYIGGSDIFRGNEVTQAMSYFQKLADEIDCAVVVLRHLTKSNKGAAIFQGQGSMSFAGTARVVINVGEHPHEEGMLLAGQVKNNLTRKAPVLSFRLENVPGERDATRVVWGDYNDELTADDIVIGHQKKEKKEEPIKKALEKLREMLEDGPLEVTKVERASEKWGISRSTLHRAADELQVVKKLRGFGRQKCSVWSLP